MDFNDAAFNLESMAKEFLRLAKRLTDKDGRPLDTNERALVRLSYTLQIEELTDMIKTAFISGRINWAMDEITKLGDLISNFK